MIVHLLLALGAGAGAGLGLYRGVEVSDLVYRQRVASAARAATRERGFWALAFRLWGARSEEICRSVHMDPVLLLRIQLLVPLAMAGILGLILRLGWPLVAAVALLGFWGLPRAILRSEESDRRAAILGELPDTLGPILEAVELTGDPIQGIRAGLAYTSPGGPLREEFVRVLAETQTHHDFSGAIEGWAERVGHPLARDMARALVVGFQRRLHAQALWDVRDKLAAIRVMVVEAATQAVPNYMAAAGGAMFMSYMALLLIPGYEMVHSGFGLL